MRGPIALPAPLSVLIVEDDPFHATIIREALEGLPMPVEVVVADCLSAAADLLNGIQLVFLDLRLPDSDGPEALESLLGMFAGVPVIVMTATEDTAVAVLALERGAEDFLVKGQFDESALARALRHARERFKLRADLRRHAEALEATVQAVRQARDGLVITDLDGTVLFANSLATLEFGAAVGSRFNHGLTAGGRFDLGIPEGRVTEAVVGGTTWQEQPALVATLRDVTDRRAAEREQLQRNQELGSANRTLDAMAAHDSLTGAWNRRGVDALIQRLYQAETTVHCLLIDCDDFKWVNDIHGHDTGDQALRELTAIIRANIGPGDHLGRLGGDEFVVLLPDTELMRARAVADQICAAVSRTVVAARTGTFRLSCSVGLADATGARSIPEAVRGADDMLACSKARGKGCVSGADDRLGWAHRPLLRLSDRTAVGREFYRGRDLSTLVVPISPDAGLAYFRVESAALAEMPVSEHLAALAQGNRAIIAVGRVALERLVRIRACLREAGVPFGLGSPWEVGSVAYLRPDLISIGRRWTAGAGSDPSARSALLQMVAMAHATGARTFASDLQVEDADVVARAGVELGTLVEAE